MGLLASKVVNTAIHAVIDGAGGSKRIPDRYVAAPLSVMVKQLPFAHQRSALHQSPSLSYPPRAWCNVSPRQMSVRRTQPTGEYYHVIQDLATEC